ncbi:MAG: hypothetical protein OEL66_05070 [Desulfobulbaceae bacterium]|nr:hypothetical protein [Desulfobulbaceae bacterium]
MTRRKKGIHIPAELSILAKLAQEYGHADPSGEVDDADRFKQPYNEVQWQGISTELKKSFAPHDWERMRLLAQGIREGLLWCDETMDRYCGATCHACRDFCCDANGIYYDLADLIYLLILDGDLPVSQTRAKRNTSCRYLSAEGCILPRMCRPFICTWYLCEPQMELLEAEPIPFQKQFTAVTQMIRRCRRQLLALHETSLRKPL